MNSNKKKLEESKIELNSNKKTLQENLKSLENGKTQYENGIKELKENIQKIEYLLQDGNLTEEEIYNYNLQLNALNEKYTQTQEEYNKFITEKYNVSIKQINEGLKLVEKKESELKQAEELLNTSSAELNKSRQKLLQKKKEYEKSYKTFKEAKIKYDNNVKTYNNAVEKIKEAEGKLILEESKLNSKKNEYNSGVKTLDDVKKELEEKETEYYEKLEEYEEKEPDAQEKITNGEKDLQEAKNELGKLESPVYEVDNRRETPGGEGYDMYQTVSNIIDSLSNIFPLFMYFVAALVTLTTMTRFVDEERINMGTLKALGYEDKDIVKKFIIYGFLASFIGTIIGVGLGHFMIPFIAYNAYSSGFSVPKIEIHFYIKETIMACILSFICSVIPAYITAKNNLKEKPSELLLPKAPAKGAKILLERIKFIWKKMSFTKKVTARNIFRYKKRMLMTIFGVAGASALIFTGFSVQHSISTINDKQFKNIIKYNMIVATNSDMSIEEENELNKLLSSDDVKNKSSIYYESITKEAGAKNDKQEINLIVPEDMENFNEYIN